MPEAETVRDRYEELCDQPRCPFPEMNQPLDVSRQQGVYIIIRRSDGRVMHVGKTDRRQDGLHGRMRSHLSGNSSFVREYLQGNKKAFRDNYSFQYIAVEDPRLRALLECYAIGHLCPAHLGCGARRA